VVEQRQIGLGDRAAIGHPNPENKHGELSKRILIEPQKKSKLTEAIGAIPYRLALAGGWIDQPFVSRHNPNPPGSMVVVSLQPTFRFMDRSGFATGTRDVARKIWKDLLPEGEPMTLVRELYRAENEGKPEPSGSQDMVGLIYPGVSRLDYDFKANGGVFPTHMESLNAASITQWLEQVLHLLSVAPRPEDYNPLGEKNLDPSWISRLGQTGKDCFDAILRMDANALGVSFNDCMKCWERILPNTVFHPSLPVPLKPLLSAYQAQYSGAMYSGCGGGYLIVASERPVPGSFKVDIRITENVGKRRAETLPQHAKP